VEDTPNATAPPDMLVVKPVMLDIGRGPGANSAVGSPGEVSG